MDHGARKQALIKNTTAFCRAHLDKEYEKLCRQLIEQMARAHGKVLARGSLDIWAAGIVHALGSANFLFDQSTKPYVRAAEIADFFGVKAGSVAQKAAAIRDLMQLDPFNLNGEFVTSTTRQQQDEITAMMVQTIGSLVPGAPLPLILSEMPNFGRRPPREVEFGDDDRDAMNDFYEIAELYQSDGETAPIQKQLRQLIARDPDFYDSYLMLADVLRNQNREEEAVALVEEAANRALRRILDRKGNWPRRLQWGWLENRHILRALMMHAIRLWKSGENEAALDIFRKLLACNPDDNQGVRHYLLAIRLGLSFDRFEEKFETDGYYTADVFDWFEKNSPRFPEEFAAWKSLFGENGTD